MSEIDIRSNVWPFFMSSRCVPSDLKGAEEPHGRAADCESNKCSATSALTSLTSATSTPLSQNVTGSADPDFGLPQRA